MNEQTESETELFPTGQWKSQPAVHLGLGVALSRVPLTALPTGYGIEEKPPCGFSESAVLVTTLPRFLLAQKGSPGPAVMQGDTSSDIFPTSPSPLRGTWEKCTPLYSWTPLRGRPHNPRPAGIRAERVEGPLVPRVVLRASGLFAHRQTLPRGARWAVTADTEVSRTRPSPPGPRGLPTGAGFSWEPHVVPGPLTDDARTPNVIAIHLSCDLGHPLRFGAGREQRNSSALGTRSCLCQPPRCCDPRG